MANLLASVGPRLAPALSNNLAKPQITLINYELMKTLRPLLLLLCLLPLSSYAAARWYKVELLIFSQLSAETVDSEQWPILTSDNIHLPLNVIELQPTRTESGGYAYSLLPRSEFEMDREEGELRARPGYKILLHIAWKQPVVSPRRTRAIHIYGGQQYGNSGDSLYASQGNWQINGILKLSVQHYLNSTFDLFYGVPTSELRHLSHRRNFKLFNTDISYFQLRQTRRMRSQQLNYFGHPLFGILMYVTPLS